MLPTATMLDAPANEKQPADVLRELEEHRLKFKNNPEEYRSLRYASYFIDENIDIIQSSEETLLGVFDLLTEVMRFRAVLK